MDMLWQPSKERIQGTHWHQFNIYAQKLGLIPEGQSLHAWSIQNRASFWSALIKYLEIPWESSRLLPESEHDTLPGARWGTGITFNFARFMVQHEGDALVSLDETGHRCALTFSQLRDHVHDLRTWMQSKGITAGDRVGAVLPNGHHAVIALLATASLGAVFSSCSPDFGTQGLIDRLGQIEPKLLISCAHYRYAGKDFDIREKIVQVQKAIPSIEYLLESSPSPDFWTNPDVRAGSQFLDLQDWPEFPFDHPLCILYSSGTTGVPKCIIHSCGGTYLQHMKELALHTDVHAGDRIAYYTTCGWMMWNWLVSALGLGATIVLYDGSPFAPETRLWDLVDSEQLTHLGTSAKYLAHAEKIGLVPAHTHQLQSLRAVLSTGSPLAHGSFDYVYQQIKNDLCLSSISGGTDIISCFALGQPAAPVYRGALQTLGLGMDVVILDEQGQELPTGAKGELCFRQSFPSMPLGFWNDPDGQRYHAAYFSRFPGIWAHGDFAEKTAEGGLIIYGRSDAVLNPGGVRIGTAEIYRQVERLAEIVEALAIGQKVDDDERIVLFVRLADGILLDDALKKKICLAIREGTTPRHVPAVIAQVEDLPRTRSGKIAELAVRQVVHGEPVKNTEALANPESLRFFQHRPELHLP